MQAEYLSREYNLDTLHAILFEDDAKNIRTGERIKITGEIKPRQDLRTKRFSSVLLAKTIQYEQQKNIDITSEDIKAFKKFRNFPDFEARIVSMFAPNFIGGYDNKLTLLLSTIGAPESYDIENDIKIRGRINVLIIGPPSCGKTKLAIEAVKLRITSKRVSGKNTTGGSLTAMFLMEDGHLTVHLGAAALANNGILFVNEFDKTPLEHRDNVLEVMEEGEIIVNKFAELLKIAARTSIIATANPKDEKWIYPNEITLEELPFSLRELSRFDAVLIIRDDRTKETDKAYADEKLKSIEKDINVNYNFLRKYIEYVNTEIKPSLMSQAIEILNEYWVDLRDNAASIYLVDKRTLEKIHRFAKAFARLNFSDVIDEAIAKRTIEFMNNMLVNFDLKLPYKNDPSIYAYKEIINALKTKSSIDNPVDLVNFIRRLCKRDVELRNYIGTIFELKKNKVLRRLYDKILENPQIKRTGNARTTNVYWIEKDQIVCDLSDLGDRKK